jgi:chromate transporter
MNWLIFFLVVLKASLFSIGGFGPLPSLHADFIAHGWAVEKQFTESLAVGQVTPGPNGLWVVSICYLVAGLPGAILACVALMLPPLLVLVLQLCYARIANRPTTQGLLDGIVLVIVSFSVIVLGQLFYSTGLDVGMVIIAVLSAILAIKRVVATNVILLLAAIIGLIW